MQHTDLPDQLLNLINSNKRFPAYQAERRIDIFINFFLEDILKHKIGKGQNEIEIDVISPEFPLKKEEGNQSTNMDYLCLVRSHGTIIKLLFVELKTDSISFSNAQYQTYLNYKNNKTWKDCIKELSEISISRGMPFSYRKKYYYMIKTLIQFDLISCSETTINVLDQLLIDECKVTDKNEKTRIRKKFTKGIKDLLDDSNYSAKPYPIEIVYLAPQDIINYKGFNTKEVNLITFEELKNSDVVTQFSEVWTKLIEMLNEN